MGGTRKEWWAEADGDKRQVLLDESRDIEKRAVSADVDAEIEIWDGMIHVWHAFYQMLPEGEQAIERMGSYLSAKWNSAEKIPVI